MKTFNDYLESLRNIPPGRIYYKYYITFSPYQKLDIIKFEKKIKKIGAVETQLGENIFAFKSLPEDINYIALLAKKLLDETVYEYSNDEAIEIDYDQFRR